MLNLSAELISHYEACSRKGYWSREWEAQKLHPTEIVRRAIAGSLIDPERRDKGEYAGELVMGLCGDRGLEVRQTNRYDIAIHHAALADIVTTYLSLRSGAPWTRPEPFLGVNLRWDPKCLARGQELTRIVLVDSWNEEREASEARSWWTLGDMAIYKLPMVLEIIILGASFGGRRHSYWTKCLSHPRNHELRFRKKHQITSGWKDSWKQIYREDRGDISRDEWIAAMVKDDALAEVTKTVKIDALSPERVRDLRGILERKAEKLWKLRVLPDPTLSACDWPIPCPFRLCCFAEPRMLQPQDTGKFRRRDDPSS